jgi:hypothetical protein
MKHTFNTFLLILATFTGCAPSSEATGPTVPNCDVVCSNLTTRCGATAPRCPSLCASFSDSVKQCIANATSCGAAQSCLTTEPNTDAGTVRDASNTTDAHVPQADATRVDPSPCGTCGPTQYCVRGRGTMRCWTPPASCTEACAPCLNAVLFSASGPCPAGTGPGCESSATSGRIINCI